MTPDVNKLEKLVKVLESYGSVTKEEQLAFMQDVINVLRQFKAASAEINTNTRSLNEETKGIVNQALLNLQGEFKSILEKARAETERTLGVKDSFSKELDKALQRVDEAILELSAMHPRDGKDGRDGRDGKDGKDGAIDNPDQIVEKVNKSKKKIDLERIDGLNDLEKRIKADVAMPVTTTFVNGKRAKNLQFNNSTVVVNGDTATVTPAGLSSIAWGDITGTLSNQTDLQTALDGKVDENASITGATKTKITYDTKGLVTAGADATTADIAASTDKNYVTDAQLTVIGNTSGTNTGDQLTFKTIAVSGQSDVVADTTTDTLTLVAGTNVTITTNATTDAITINASGGGSPGGSDTQVQFNDGGSFGGDADYTWNKTTNTLTLGTTPTMNVGSPNIGDVFTIKALDATSGSLGGTLIQITGADGFSTGSGGSINIVPGTGGATNGNGGDVYIQGGAKSGSGTAGHVIIGDPVAGNAVFDTASVTGNKTFTFPNSTGTFVLNDNVATLSNKRRTPRVYTAANNASLTPEIDTYDVFHLTAMSAATTINNHSTSTPTDGELMRFRFLDNGTARALTWGTNYVAKAGVALPTTTVLSKNLTCLFEWNSNLSKWNLLASGQEA